MPPNLRFGGKKRVHVAIPVGSAVAAGNPSRVSGTLGIPLNHGIAGQTVAFALDGTWGLTLSIGGTLNEGTHLYWDTSAAALSIGYANDDIYFGYIKKTPASGSVYDVTMAEQPMPPRGQDQPETP